MGYISVEFLSLLTYVHLFVGYNLMTFSMINLFLLTIFQSLYSKYSYQIEFLIHCFRFLVCNCDKVGSQSQTCDGNGKCICKYGYKGQTYSACIDGFYQQMVNNFQPTCWGITALYRFFFGVIAIIAKFIAHISINLLGNSEELLWSCNK